MDSAFISAIDAVASKLSLRVVDEQISPPLWGSDGNRCILIDDLRLCASVVPIKNEIEVWLEDKSGPDGPQTFGTGMLRAVLDEPYAAIMFSEKTYRACLAMMASLMERVASALMNDRQEFMALLRTEYQARLL